MALRRAAAGVAGFGALGCGAFYASDPTTAQRTFVLYSEMAPVIIAYRVLEQKQKLRRDWNGHENPALEDAEWAALHEQHAAPTVACMRRMLGSYVKLGQFLALRPDIVPDVWTKELRTLENAVPPQATDLVLRVKDTVLWTCPRLEIPRGWVPAAGDPRARWHEATRRGIRRLKGAAEASQIWAGPFFVLCSTW